MKSKWYLLFGLVTALAFAVTACQPAATTTTTTTTGGQTVELGEKTLTASFGYGDIPTLDPSKAQDTSSIQVAIELFPGLTRPDEVSNEDLLGMAAEPWDISADGTVYTFKIMEGIPWVKYDEVAGEVVQVLDDEGAPRTVKAQDFEYGFLRTLDSDVASPYAYVLNFVLAGGDEYNGATTDEERAALRDAVGVKVIDDYTIQLTFKAPAAYNASIAGMWMGYAQPSWLIEAVGDRWFEPGIIQSYGPYALKEWIHDYSATMIVNPFWPGTDSMPVPKIKEVTFRFLDTPETFAEYEAGNMDISAVDTDNLERVKADPVLSKEYLELPYFCSYYYGFNTTNEPVDDVRVRRALSLAVDRKSLVENVLKGGQQPSQWLENPGLNGAPTLETHPDAGIKYDPDLAATTLQEYLDEKGVTAASLDITLMFNTSAGHQRIAEALQLMWKDTLGVDVKLANQEWAVHLAMMDGPDATEIFRTGWCLDYADANNFTKDLIALGGSNNLTSPTAKTVPYGGIQWYNAEYEALITQASAELDFAKRQDLYAQASTLAMFDEAVVIPIYWYSRNSMTKPYVVRTFSSGGHEHFEKWDIDLEARAAYNK